MRLRPLIVTIVGLLLAASVLWAVFARSSGSAIIETIRPESWKGVEPLVRELIEERLTTADATPRSATAWAALGRAYHAHRYVDLAGPCYEQSLRLDDSDATTWYYLAHIRSELGDADGALDALDEAARRTTPPAFFAWRRGFWLTRVGRLEQAGGAFEEALRIDPDSVPARIGLARAVQLDGRHQHVIDILMPIVDQPVPNVTFARHVLGTSLIQVGQEETGRSLLASQPNASLSWADPWLDELQRDRRDEPWIISQAQNMIRVGRVDEAMAAIAPLVEQYPDDPTLLKLQGMAAFTTGDFDTAAEHLRRVIERQPDDAGAHLNLALVLEQAQRFEQSADAAKRAAELDPTNPHTGLQLGRSLVLAGRSGEGVEVLQALVDREPNFAPAHAWLAWGLADEGRTGEARSALDRARRLEPRLPEIAELSRRLNAS